MRTTRRGVLAGATAAITGCLGGPRADAGGEGAGSGAGADAGTSECFADSLGAGETRIGFVGDVMLGRSVNDHWTGGEPAGVWG
ncbi:MAG: hypothetical protein ACI8XM_002764, partial [Haloarculaceae archaeon]